jgi:hypothetical protein
MPLNRVWLALGACGVSAAFAITGGACTFSSSPPPTPSLISGSYVLNTIGGQAAPQVTFTDATGRRIRVIADTLQITTSSHGYVEHGSIAITPVGGTEQAPAAINSGQQPYTVTGTTTFQLPTTIAGVGQGTILTNTAIDVRMPDGSHWNFQLR